MKNIKQALHNCNYPKWAFDRVYKKKKEKASSTNEPKTKDQTEKARGSVGIPYVHGMAERIKRTLKSYKINTYFIPQNKIRQGLVHPKEKIQKEETCGCIYEVSCLNCNKVYIGETGRSLKTRIQEHQTDVKNNATGIRTRSRKQSDDHILHKSAITDHTTQLNHTPNWDTKILQKESSWFERKVKESLWIRKTKDNMNRDEGGHILSHIYDDLIQDQKTKRGKGGGGPTSKTQRSTSTSTTPR